MPEPIKPKIRLIFCINKLLPLMINPLKSPKQLAYG